MNEIVMLILCTTKDEKGKSLKEEEKVCFEKPQLNEHTKEIVYKNGENVVQDERA